MAIRLREVIRLNNLEIHNEVMFYKGIVEGLYSEVRSLQGDIKDLRKELSVYSESAKRLSTQLDMSEKFGETLHE